ncbi:hypothetical protein [Nocardia sp. A7]|uniref:hypothetical protein n=1 Tax=Nocardia sp. A7 TaxID=2789274 RepID=UPI00397CDC70
MRVAGRLHITAAAVALPTGCESLSDAVASGAITTEQAAASDTEKLWVTEAGQSAESLALAAAADALTEAGLSGSDIGLLTHAWMIDTPDDWKTASRLARLLGAKHAIASSTRQMSNGGAVATQFALAQMLAEPRIDNAMVVTADALGPGENRRWQISDSGAALSDSATALILGRSGGSLSVQSIVSRGCPDQEAFFDGYNPLAIGQEVSEASKNAFSGPFAFRLRGRVRTAIQQACADADLAEEDPRLTVTVLPRINSTVTAALTEGLLPTEEIVHLSAQTGHLFAGDLIANLNYLRTRRPLAAGEYGLVINIGLGFTVTALVVCGTEEKQHGRDSTDTDRVIGLTAPQ